MYIWVYLALPGHFAEGINSGFVYNHIMASIEACTDIIWHILLGTARPLCGGNKLGICVQLYNGIY